MNLLYLHTKNLVIIIILMIAKGVFAQNPNWQPPNPKNFSKTATAIAIIHIDDVRSNNMGDRIAFFVGNELRGLSKPITLGSGIVHFTTIYSNSTSEIMTVKVYQFNTMTTYDVATTFSFVTQGRTGKIDNPWIVNGYQGDDAPISILPIPDQSTLFGLPYNPIDLSNYLAQPDPTPISWSFVANPFLNVSIANGILQVTGLSTLQGMETTLEVHATEATGQMAVGYIVFELVQDFAAPSWTTIPNQSILIGTQFDTIQLDSFEVDYIGNHLKYDYIPIVEQALDTVANPLWIANQNNKNTMSIIAQVKYTPKYTFNHPQDKLITTVNGVIRGLARPNGVSDKYYLSVGGVPNGSQMKFQFYSGLKKQILTLIDSFTYNAYDILGSSDAPIVFDFAPLVPTISPNGETIITIRDTTWTGLETFQFIAADSIYPGFKFDTKRASYCIVNDLAELDTLYQDADGDGLGNPLVFILACLGTDGFVTNDNDCNDDQAVDPSLIVSLSETSGQANNDGYICEGAAVILSASGGQSYQWSSGQTTASISITPSVTTHYTVTMTQTNGCQSALDIIIYVEGTVVRQSGNDGFGSLREVFNCITEGGTITFNQPQVISSQLTESIIITKNVTIKGLSATSRPIINIDYLNPNNGIRIANTKVLQLDNVDIGIRNNNNSIPTLSGKGQLIIKNKTIVIDY